MERPGLSAVVNCAAYTAVDRAESERDCAFAVNAEGARIVARAAAKCGLPIIHLSTDYVYSGAHPDAYAEDFPVSPINEYGRSKAAGDAAVAAENASHVLLRVSWVFGAHGTNFVKTMLQLARERRDFGVVDDQKGGPTDSSDIADAILVIATACRRPGFSAWGIYHFAGSPATSWYGFAGAIFKHAGASVDLRPIATCAYPTRAERPLNSRLDCSKIRRVFGIEQPDWRVAVTRVVKELERDGA